MKTRKQFLTLAATALLLTAPRPLLAQQLSSGASALRVAVFGQPSASPAMGGGSSPRTVIRYQRVVKQVTKYRSIYITPRPGTISFNGLKVQWNNKPVIINDRFYVPLCEMLEIMEQYGLRTNATYTQVNGKHHVDVTIEPIRSQGAKPGSNESARFELLFSNGLFDMWHGRVQEAIQSFRAAEKLGTSDAEDAKGMADWLSEERNTGMIRFHWWNIPKEVKVLVDEQEVTHGTVMAALSGGVHQLKLIGKQDIVIYDQKIRIDSNQAFVVEFGARPRS
jgi:hypothetical protein